MKTKQTGPGGRGRTRAAARLLALALCLFTFACCLPARAQETIDRMVAVVNGRELITYTDQLWQLALEPDTPLDEPRQEDLARALDLLIDQRLILQEAEKLPTIAPTAEEVKAELTDLIKLFPSASDFYRRLRRVGLGEDSELLREIVRQRVAIKNYVEFRFGSFVVVTPQEVAAYYRDVWVPRQRREAPGSIVPKLEQDYARIERELKENKKGSDIDAFLDEARAAAEINILQ